MKPPKAKLIFYIVISCCFFLNFKSTADTKSADTSSTESKKTALLKQTAKEKKLKNIVKEQITNHSQAVLSQKKISLTADLTKDITDKYRSVLRQIENARIYNQQLRNYIKEQKKEDELLRIQITEVKQTRKNIIPLMLEMYTTLESFIKNDIPFLPAERTNRLKELKKILNRADISVSEKYRRLIEAYKIENDYGNKIESYSGSQIIDGKNISVQYLRVGRLALIYQTRDGKRSAYWDQNKKQWTAISSRYQRAITRGLQVALKQKAPALLIVPIPAPQKDAL